MPQQDEEVSNAEELRPSLLQTLQAHVSFNFEGVEGKVVHSVFFRTAKQ